MDNNIYYETRQKAKTKEAIVKSRVNWKRTKRDSLSLVFRSSSGNISTSEDKFEESDSETLSSRSSISQKSEDKLQEKVTSEDIDEECILPSKRKRSSTVMLDSDSSSDSDGPNIKVPTKRCRVLEEDNDDNTELIGTAEQEAVEAKPKKQRLEKLKQLAEKRKSKRQSTNSRFYEDSDVECQSSHQISEDTSENEDRDSINDFIVSDEEEYPNNENDVFQLAKHQELFAKHHIPLLSQSDIYSHLQRVIKAFLINIIDNNFLISLYDGVRTKKYAKEMLNSLNHLEKRIIVPRLEKLTTSCRWSQRYKERVGSYPKLCINAMNAQDQPCQACQLHRHCRFEVTLSGQAYCGKTFDNDDFMSDNEQVFEIGKVCAGRTSVYHQLKHYKYHLYQTCKQYINEIEESSVKERVEHCLTRMEERGIIKQEVDLLEHYLNEADFFQEETID